MSKLKTIFYLVRERPLNVLVWKFYCKMFKATIPKFKYWKELVNSKSGLEIGGPSGMFAKNGYLPIYPLIQSLDGVNFSNNTLWEENLNEGSSYKYGDKTGFQFIGEGTDLSIIPNGSYDFVLSCNNLEHIANPIKAIVEWKRVMNDQGIMLLILPRKESNFDYRRTITKIDHLVQDYQSNMAENDLTHLNEILELHDLSRDPQAGSFEQFKNRSLNNLENRGLHHHVYDQGLLRDIANYSGLKPILNFSSPTDHFIALSKIPVSK